MVPPPPPGSAEEDIYFRTPPGWLAKYLEKNGPDKLFPAEGTTVVVFKRVKE